MSDPLPSSFGIYFRHWNHTNLLSLRTVKYANLQVLWCWRRPFRVPWTAKRSKQSILKEINPEYSLKGLMLKLKLRYFGYLMQGADLLEKILMLGKIEGRKRRG